MSRGGYIAGHKAEHAAATYLEMRGYKIIEMNYRKPRCEIDIIATKDNTAYLVEVKYRASGDQGSGFDYITASKLKQMQFAAEIWAQDVKWPGDYQLAAVELSGPTYAVEHFIDNVF